MRAVLAILLASLVAIALALGLSLWRDRNPPGAGATSARPLSPEAIARRLDRLEDRVSDLADRVESPGSASASRTESTRVPPGVPDRAILDRLEILETKLTLLQRSSDDQLARALIAIEALERRVEGAGALNDVDRERIRQATEEENRAAYEKRLREMQTSSQDARARWIGEVAADLGLSDAQRDAVLKIYDVQASRWSQIFERVQLNELSPSRTAEEMQALRRETDGKLREYLTEDQVRRLRELETARFPSLGSH